MEAGPGRSGDGGFATPAELSAVAPEAVQEQGESRGDRDLGLLEAAAHASLRQEARASVAGR